MAWGCVLAAAAIALSWFQLPPAVLAVLGAYVVNNVLYNARVKTVAIADVISIATGFVLRLVAGAIAIGVVASSWLLVCSFSLALFLGFGKRRSELALAEQGRVYRPVLRAYTASTLDSAMGISATLTLMCYMLYTIAPETRETHGTGNLIYTVPPVFYAMFRFIFKVQDARGESPEELLLRDRVMLVTAAAWVGLVLLVLKFRVVDRSLRRTVMRTARSRRFARRSSPSAFAAIDRRGVRRRRAATVARTRVPAAAAFRAP